MNYANYNIVRKNKLFGISYFRKTAKTAQRQFFLKHSSFLKVAILDISGYKLKDNKRLLPTYVMAPRFTSSFFPFELV